MHEGPLHYRTRTNRTSTILWAAGIPTALYLMELSTDDEPLHWLQTSLTVILTALFIYILYSAPRTFTRIDNNGISLRSNLRTRRLHWADIYDIRTVTPPMPSVGESSMPTEVVYAYKTNGRRILLPNLNSSELEPEAFTRETASVRRLLENHRRPNWVADPHTETDITRHEARYAKRYKALTSRISLTLMTIVILATIITCTTVF
ncbi:MULTISPECIES: PH domain-containing protein [unclassified Streptomyces]|uniref:PH domain-containing protein n=1 Tax=unclassified Streptomyces TaxID=2593676 RepID=UPI000D144258|nr:PH domain-containing protein [Streptomyces sp. NRRL F-2747]